MKLNNLISELQQLATETGTDDPEVVIDSEKFADYHSIIGVSRSDHKRKDIPELLLILTQIDVTIA